MMCLDVFLSSLTNEESEAIQHQIKPLKHKSHSLMSYDIMSHYLLDSFIQSQKSIDLQSLLSFNKKFHWNIDLEQLLQSEYTALVLTNIEKKIVWANKGFTKMTGYPVNFAVGKKASFLQGKETSPVVLEKIRQHLSSGIPFNETIINYTQQHVAYNCHVSITPLRNYANEITHFIALERKGF